MSKQRKSIFERMSIFRKSSFSGRSPLFNHHTLADAAIDTKNIKQEHKIKDGITQIGSISILLGQTMSMIFTAKCDKGESWKMAHRFTNGSLIFVTIAMAFVGMIMVYQSSIQMSRSIGDTSLVGASFLKLLVRVLGPTVIGMLISCRVGAGIAAEIGAMAVTEQIDAMKMCAAQPIETLIVPRLRGGIVAGLSLSIIGSAASVLAGLLTAIVCFSMSTGVYWNLELIVTSDVIQGLVKALCYGIVVPIISGACGLSAKGGARGVGQATTNAVVGSSFAIVVLDSIISLLANAVS